MNLYLVEYTTKHSYQIWANSPSEAVVGIENTADYYETLLVTDQGALPYTLGQTVYVLDTVDSAIEQGTVNQINHVGPSNTKVFIRFAGESTDIMYTYPDEAAKIYTSLDDLLAYLTREVTALAPPPPGIPTSLSASNITTTSFVLNWLPVPSSTGYKVYKEGHLLYSNVLGTSVLLSGLAVESTHNLRVSAINIYGESELSVPLTVSTLPILPTAPTNVAITSLSSTGFTVSWQSVLSADSYRVYLDGVLHSTATGTSKVVGNLDSNTVYEITVAAVNETGAGPQSEVLSVQTYPPVTLPPTNLSTSFIIDTSFTLNWTPAVGATSYNVYLDGDLLQEGVLGTSLFISDLEANTVYTCVVKSVSIAGESVASNALSATTRIHAPLNPVASAITSSGFTISWDAVAGATSYKIYLDGTLYQMGIATPTVAVTGRNADQLYAVEITAVNVVGESPSSVVLPVQTDV